MADRYADPITLDHIIELKKQLEEAERQRENALNACMSLRKQIDLLRDKFAKAKIDAVLEEKDYGN